MGQGDQSVGHDRDVHLLADERSRQLGAPLDAGQATLPCARRQGGLGRYVETVGEALVGPR